ncbi:hypothetical protein HDV05_001811 [Chytridiales sp. JEL 0842]|nr:hypothetical protein HDV05_001811 [Chytridiales sp. JEL 0842]
MSPSPSSAAPSSVIDINPQTAFILKQVFGNIGLLLWSFQLVPQAIQSHRKRDTGNLSLTMLLLWALWTPFFGATAIRNSLAVALIVQPNVFGVFAVVCAVQVVVFRRKGRRRKGVETDEVGEGEDGVDTVVDDSLENETIPASPTSKEEVVVESVESESKNQVQIEGDDRLDANVWVRFWLYLILSLAFIGVLEVGVWALLKVLDSSESQTVRNISTVIVLIAPFLINAGFIPQYIEIFRNKTCHGISPAFLLLDVLGGVFSILALLFHAPPFDYMSFASYAGVVVLDVGIAMLGLFWFGFSGGH